MDLIGRFDVASLHRRGADYRSEMLSKIISVGNTTSLLDIEAILVKLHILDVGISFFFCDPPVSFESERCVTNVSFAIVAS